MLGERLYQARTSMAEVVSHVCRKLPPEDVRLLTDAMIELGEAVDARVTRLAKAVLVLNKLVEVSNE